MNYCLRQYDIPLIEFSADDGAEMNIVVLKIYEENRFLIPLEIKEVSSESIESWLRHRTIPKNRAYFSNVLSSTGLNYNRQINIIRFSKGLSLNDSYWVTEEGFDGDYSDYNLYENNFSRVLGLIAFIGYGSNSGKIISSSPEFTTNGMLPKCWRRINGNVLLYKGGTEGGYNTGYEPFSEYYASKIAETIDVNAIPYNISKWKGRLCSTCKLFTDIDHSFVPVGRLVTSGGMKAVREFYTGLGEEYLNALNDMIVFDALIYNTDRHFGNFGFIVDNHTNTIVSPAPLFDHGNALFNYAGRDDLAGFDALAKYAGTLVPSTYDDYLSEAALSLTHDMRQRLRRLLDYKIPRHSRYNLPCDRLQLIDKMIRVRTQTLLDC